MNRRLHFFGASGSGTTTLGAAVAQALGIAHFDTDHFYWKPTDPPYRQKWEPHERVLAFDQASSEHASWVLSGSLCSWGEPIAKRFTAMVFVQLDSVIRLRRLERREAERYGDRIKPGGDLAQASGEFMAWAASYDTAKPPTRSLALHEEWMAQQGAPVLRVDSKEPVERLVGRVLDFLEVQ